MGCRAHMTTEYSRVVVVMVVPDTSYWCIDTFSDLKKVNWNMKKEMKLLKQMHIHSMDLLQKIKILNECFYTYWFMNHDI